MPWHYDLISCVFQHWEPGGCHWELGTCHWEQLATGSGVAAAARTLPASSAGDVHGTLEDQYRAVDSTNT